MKSINEWRMGNNNPDWENVKKIWGTGNQPVDSQILRTIKPKIEKLIDQWVQSLSIKNPEIEQFRDVSQQERDKFAQAIVVATLSSIYSSLQKPKTNSINYKNFNKTKKDRNLQQDNISAPTDWKG